MGVYLLPQSNCLWTLDKYQHGTLEDVSSVSPLVPTEKMKVGVILEIITPFFWTVYHLEWGQAKPEIDWWRGRDLETEEWSSCSDVNDPEPHCKLWFFFKLAVSGRPCNRGRGASQISLYRIFSVTFFPTPTSWLIRPIDLFSGRASPRVKPSPYSHLHFHPCGFCRTHTFCILSNFNHVVCLQLLLKKRDMMTSFFFFF